MSQKQKYLEVSGIATLALAASVATVVASPPGGIAVVSGVIVVVVVVAGVSIVLRIRGEDLEKFTEQVSQNVDVFKKWARNLVRSNRKQKNNELKVHGYTTMYFEATKENIDTLVELMNHSSGSTQPLFQNDLGAYDSALNFLQRQQEFLTMGPLESIAQYVQNIHQSMPNGNLGPLADQRKSFLFLNNWLRAQAMNCQYQNMILSKTMKTKLLASNYFVQMMGRDIDGDKIIVCPPVGDDSCYVINKSKTGDEDTVQTLVVTATTQHDNKPYFLAKRNIIIKDDEVDAMNSLFFDSVITGVDELTDALKKLFNPSSSSGSTDIEIRNSAHFVINLPHVQNLFVDFYNSITVDLKQVSMHALFQYYQNIADTSTSENTTGIKENFILCVIELCMMCMLELSKSGPDRADVQTKYEQKFRYFFDNSVQESNRDHAIVKLAACLLHLLTTNSVPYDWNAKFPGLDVNNYLEIELDLIRELYFPPP